MSNDQPINANKRLKTSQFIKLLRQAYSSWSEDGGPRLGAALSYYTTFSIAPLLIVVISVAGIIFGREAVAGKLFAELAGIVGAEAAKFIQDLVVATSKTDQSTAASIVGVIVILLGATGFFAQLQDALNIIWKVRRSTPLGLLGTLRRYWWSFSVVVGCGFLLLVSLVLSAALSAVIAFASERIAIHGLLLELLHFVLSAGIITVIFALIFKVVPDVRIHWRDVWFGAIFTALLFILGKTGLAIYLSHAAATSAYGAAGALVLILLWSYYSAQLLLFGAEFTQVVSIWRGREVQPANGFVSTRQSLEK